MGFAEILTLIFITLKLTGNVDWSWWVVFLPELVALGFYLVTLLAIGVTALVVRKR